MPTLSVHFIGGHYHATPWDRAQNEGTVEWPPSPWRLLRALIATGYAKLPDWQEGTPPSLARSLIERLASVLPAYKLPSATGTHTRHYMPTDAKPTLVLDARAVVRPDHDPLIVHWPTNLPPDEQALFDALSVRLGYLGRAESWTECATVAPPAFSPSVSSGWTVPHVGQAPTPPNCEQLALIAPVSTDTYSDWLQALSLPKSKESAPAPTLFDALHVETSWLQKNGWSAPPGSRLVIYDRPAASAISIAPPPRIIRRPSRTVPFALLALSSSARSRSPLPVRERTLPQAELLHRAIASRVGKLSDPADAITELIGLDSARKPATGHRHAHILPLTLLAADKHIDHILIWAPGGLSETSLGILRALRKTYMKGGVGEVEVRFAGSGSLDDFRKLSALRHVLGVAKTWQSLTPFVPPRYKKNSGRNTLEGQVKAELASRGFPAPEHIALLGKESVSLRHFARTRRAGAPPPVNAGYALRLTFFSPVSGPMALGYAAHFGLGLFMPADSHP